MKVGQLRAALKDFDQEAEIVTRGGEGTFAPYVSIRVSKQKYHKGKVVVEGCYSSDIVEVVNDPNSVN